MPYNHIGNGFSADTTRTFRNMLNQSQLKSTWRQNDRTVLLQMIGKRSFGCAPVCVQIERKTGWIFF